VDSTTKMQPDSQRRSLMQAMLGAAVMALLAPFNALAAVWNKAAFESTTLAGAVKGLEISSAIQSADIEILAPDKAENGAVVQIEITSRIPNTEAIMILVEKNPTPLIANFAFSNGALPYVVTRIKMAETSDVQAVVKVGNQYFEASRKVEVLENGCN
jgi:sulfur-oxidizing protein SoxY